MLRTPNGKIDQARTERVRAEITAADEAESARTAREAYTERWRRVLATRDGIDAPRWTWADVPWPTRAETDVWVRKEEETKRKARNVRGSNWASPGLLTSSKSAAGRPPAPAWWASSTGLESLADDAMRDFLFPAGSEGQAKPTKHQLRREMLHWHPDKFDTNVLSRVHPGERESVREGAGIVWHWLSNEALKNSEAAEKASSVSPTD